MCRSSWLEEKRKKSETQFIDHFTHCDVEFAAAIGRQASRPFRSEAGALVQPKSRTNGDQVYYEHCELLTIDRDKRRRLTTTLLLCAFL